MRKVAMRIVVVLGYWLGIDRLFYFLNRRAKRIIVFHNVLPDEIMEKERTSGAIRLSAFVATIRECLKEFDSSLDLFDPHTITFTFDDGYWNLYDVVFMEMKSMGVSGYVFFAGGAESLLAIDQMRYWKLYAPVTLSNGRLKDEYWNEVIWKKYRDDVNGRGAAAIIACEEAYPFAKVLSSLSRRHKELRLAKITTRQIEEMREAGWMVCWHTNSHYPLGWLDENEMLIELSTAHFAKDVISYPYGVDERVGRMAIDMAERLGYTAGVSNTLVSTIGFSRYFLPRLHLPGNGDKYRIHYELSGFGHFMRTRHLLPFVNLGE